MGREEPSSALTVVVVSTQQRLSRGLIAEQRPIKTSWKIMGAGENRRKCPRQIEEQMVSGKDEDEELMNQEKGIYLFPWTLGSESADLSFVLKS